VVKYWCKYPCRYTILSQLPALIPLHRSVHCIALQVSLYLGLPAGAARKGARTERRDLRARNNKGVPCVWRRHHKKWRLQQGGVQHVLSQDVLAVQKGHLWL
jgi:hypothetical protein